jgi:predicted PurR-regulated permease PerM
MPSADRDPVGRDRLTATWVELAIRLGVLGLLLFFSFTLIRPFITIAIWSVVLTVALYPVYDWIAGRLGGRRRLAALLLTITSAVLILGIIQIGPSVVLVPIVIWSWIAMDPTTAVLITIYLIPVSLLDNILRPLVMARGRDTPKLIILIGVLGGTVSYGITGLFLGPIVLAVIWELLVAWTRERESA